MRDSRNLAPPSRSFQPKGAGKNKGKGWYRSGYFAGELDGHAGDEAADDGDNYDTGMRTTTMEPMLGMVTSPVQRTQMIVTGYQMKILALL